MAARPRAVVTEPARPSVRSSVTRARTTTAATTRVPAPASPTAAGTRRLVSPATASKPKAASPQTAKAQTGWLRLMALSSTRGSLPRVWPMPPRSWTYTIHPRPATARKMPTNDRRRTADTVPTPASNRASRPT